MRKVVTTKTSFVPISTDQFSLEINTLQIELFKRLLKEDLQKMHKKTSIQLQLVLTQKSDFQNGNRLF